MRQLHTSHTKFMYFEFKICLICRNMLHIIKQIESLNDFPLLSESQCFIHDAHDAFVSCSA